MSMKHSRAEVVKSTVCAYLKRRQYTDSEVLLKSDLQLCQTKQQLAVLEAVNKEAANHNSITFSSLVLDFNVVDQHFSRLKAWVSRLTGSVHRELYAFLPPLLCHLTMDMLQLNVVLESNSLPVSSAIGFLKKHASSLLMEETLTKSESDFGTSYVQNKDSVCDQNFNVKNWRLLEELANLENCWDICKSKPLLLFRSFKYRLTLTSEAVAVLQKYLADHAHICLIQAIGTWFDVVEVPNIDIANEEDGEEDDEDEVVVQLWEEDSLDGGGMEAGPYNADLSNDMKPPQELSVAMNGSKEDPSSQVVADDAQSLPGSSQVPADQRPLGSNAAHEMMQEEEEKQMRLLEAAIQGVEDAPSPQNPILLYSIHNSDDNVVCTKVSHNGNMLGAGFGTSEIKVWGLTEGGLPADIREFAGGTNFVFNKDKKRTARLACDIASSFFEGDVYGSLLEEEEEDWTSSPLLLRGHNGPVQDVVFSGNVLFSCSTDTTLRSWNLTDHSCMAIYRSHTYPVWCLDVCAWGLYLASGSHDRTARLWCPERVYSLRTYAGHGLDVDCVRFHPNGMYLATGSCDNSVRLWSVTEGKLVRVFPHASRSRASSTPGSRSGVTLTPVVTSLAFSPDGKFLASGAEDQRIRIWDLAAGSVLSELTLPTSASTEAALSGSSDEACDTFTPPANAASVTGLSWSTGGDRLACGFRDGTVAVWEAKKGHWAEFLTANSTTSHSSNSSLTDDLRSKSSGAVAHSQSADYLTTYSTGMRPLTSIRYIDKNVLVATGCTPPRQLE